MLLMQGREMEVTMSILAAYVVPHPPIMMREIGKGQEQEIKETIESYERIAKQIAEYAPELILVFSPHSVMYSDYFHISPGKKAKGNFWQFGHKELEVFTEYDEEFSKELEKEAAADGIAAGRQGEREAELDHGTMVPLRMIQEAYKGTRIVRIGLSGFSLLTHYRFGKCIARTVSKLERRAVIIASGDLSHVLKEDGPYGFCVEGPEFDKRIMKDLSEAAFGNLFDYPEDLLELASECGMRSFVIMAGCLDGLLPTTEKLSYEGPFGVGYGVVAFRNPVVSENRQFDQIYEKRETDRLLALKEKEDDYVALARASLETFVRTKKRYSLPEEQKNDLDDEMISKQAGVFVSLKLDGQLRGCIGTIAPTKKCIADEIIQNAVSAGMEDPRFPPVSEEELGKLVYSVDVLSPPESIASLSELDPDLYGVIISCKGRRGLLLPNLPGITTVEKQVEIAMQKGGIKRYEEYSLERFKVIRHH